MNELKFNDKYHRPFSREWIKTLMFGDYVQVEGSLCIKKITGELSFCCLGVAEDLNNTAFMDFGGLRYYLEGEEYEKDSDLTRETQKRLGLRSPTGDATVKTNVDDLSLVLSLSEMNDSENFTFEQIAQVLLDNPEKYFLPIEKLTNELKDSKRTKKNS